MALSSAFPILILACFQAYTDWQRLGARFGAPWLTMTSAFGSTYNSGSSAHALLVDTLRVDHIQSNHGCLTHIPWLLGCCLSLRSAAWVFQVGRISLVLHGNHNKLQLRCSNLYTGISDVSYSPLLTRYWFLIIDCLELRYPSLVIPSTHIMRWLEFVVVLKGSPLSALIVVPLSWFTFPSLPLLPSAALWRSYHAHRLWLCPHMTAPCHDLIKAPLSRH